MLRALNLNPTEADVKKIVNEVDPNGEHVKLFFPNSKSSGFIHSNIFIRFVLTICVKIWRYLFEQ